MILDWTVSLQNPIYRGFYPKNDPFNDNYFYIGDGWGSMFPSMKLRKLDIETGKEISSVRVNNNVRFLHFHANKTDMFASTDNRIFRLDRTTLKIQDKFDKDILKYTDYINSNNSGKLLLMNRRGSQIMVFDYLEKKSFKKKIGASCNGIIRETDSNFLILDYFNGTILRYNLENNNVEKVSKTSSFYNAEIAESGKIYLQKGVIEYDNTGLWKIKQTPEIRVFKAKDYKEDFSLYIKSEFEDFLITDDENEIYLCHKNIFEIYSIAKRDITFKYEFDTDLSIISILKSQRKIFLYSNYGPREKTLFCYNF